MTRISSGINEEAINTDSDIISGEKCWQRLERCAQKDTAQSFRFKHGDFDFVYKAF